MATGRRNLRRLIGSVFLIGIVAVVIGAWFFFFRDTSAESVDSVEVAEARQAAIAEATESGSEIAAVEGSASQSEAADPTGDQADAAAAVGGGPSDGLWTIDTSIGTFGQDCLENACGAGFVGFRIQEELASIGAKTVVGRTPAVSGSLEIVGTQIVAVDVTADMTQLITDDERRNGAIRGPSGGLETDAFPEASFVLVEPIELNELPAEGVSIQVEAVGDLTVRGVTNRVTVPLTAEQQAGLIIVFGTLENLALADFEIPTPTALVVVSVDDVAAMELQLFFSR